MKIIIEVKDTATLDRIEELGHALESMKSPGLNESLYIAHEEMFSDVIKSISKEF